MSKRFQGIGYHHTGKRHLRIVLGHFGQLPDSEFLWDETEGIIYQTAKVRNNLAACQWVIAASYHVEWMSLSSINLNRITWRWRKSKPDVQPLFGDQTND